MDSAITTKKGGVWQRLLDALYKSMGSVVPNEELIRVSGQHNYARRIRELRAEGWDIVYSASPSGYILRSLDKTEKNADEYINQKLRLKVLERDRFTCQLCGHKAQDKYADGEQVRLEIDHISPLKQGGKTTEENLWTLCSRCNAGKKSLFDYPETVKNRIISVNLPDEIRESLSQAALKRGVTVNNLLLEVIERGIKGLD
jgi:hypothetical protein